MSGASGLPSSSIANEDLLALQAYVTAKDATQYDTLHKDTVVLDLTHSNLVQRHLEIRFDLHDTISLLRTKIYRKTGTPDAFQHLQLIRGGQVVAEIPPGQGNDKMLGYYGMQHGMSVHCIDLDPNSGSRNGQYEDVHLVEKYRMTDEEYDKRKGTIREWGRQQKSKDENFSLAKHAKEHSELVEARRQAKLGLPLPKGFEYDNSGKVVRSEEEKPVASVEKANDEDAPGPETVEGKQVGMRCEVRPGGRRGVVAFVGEVPEIGGGGYWIGVIFDEPVGKTDGTIKGGKRYFDANPNYGSFLRGKNVEVGDFPERDIMDELDTDSEDEL